uniref:DUF223 domain-containing protein n=1 Tax=Strongyloides venezuelensis TaxID=75913 RepID=A0A0K0F534_STRVS
MNSTTRFSNISSMFKAFYMFETLKLAEKFLFDNEVFPSSKNCPKCKNSLSLNGQSFRCVKKTCRANVTVRDGTFFIKMKAPLNVVLFYIYYFISGTRQNQIEMYLKIISATNAALHKYSRQLIANAVNECDVKIGGPVKIVEINEFKFEKRKHYRDYRVEGAWVLDNVELTSEKKLFVRVVESRDVETLLLITQQHVFPCTTIRTDR